MNEQTKRFLVVGAVGLLVLFALVWSALGRMEGFWGSGAGLGTWFAAFLTLSILSFLYDDNPFYRFAESLFIGVSAGYWMVQGIWQTLIPNMLGRLAPGFVNEHLAQVPLEVEAIDRSMALVQLVLGCLLLWRLAPKGTWIARWPLAVIVGWAAGTNLTRYLVSDFTKQVSPVLIPLVEPSQTAFLGIDWIGTLTALVTVFGLLAALIYFFFSVEHKGFLGQVSKGGIWILMITFGAAFGYTVMGRIALLVGPMEFLFVDWLQLIGP